MGFSICVQLLKIKEESHPFSVRLRRIHFSSESQRSFSVLPLRAGVALDPGQGFTVRDNNPPSWLVAIFPFNCKNIWRAEAPLCSRKKRRRRKKKTIIYYSNEMRSGRWWKRGWGLAAENLLLTTSVISVSPWRNKKFKGNQRLWRISLAYFQWATLEAEMGDSWVYPMQELINVCCVYLILLHHVLYTEYTQKDYNFI